MKELLDYQQPENPKPKTKQIFIKTIFYLLMMFLGSGLFASIFLGVPFTITGSLPSTRGVFYWAFGLMLAVELIKLIWRKVRKNERNLTHPLWFELLENTFVWWMILMIVLLFRNLT